MVRLSEICYLYHALMRINIYDRMLDRALQKAEKEYI